MEIDGGVKEVRTMRGMYAGRTAIEIVKRGKARVKKDVKHFWRGGKICFK